MRTKTLHSATEWKRVTGELPLESNTWIRYGDDIPPVPSQSQQRLEWLTELKEKFEPYIKASNRTSRHGILLAIIQSDAPFDVVRSALDLYRGFRSGFETLKKMVEIENKRLLEICPPETSDGPFYWSMNNKTHIRELTELFGWMQTDQAHDYLMELAIGPVHPLVKAGAVDGMAFEGKKFDDRFILELVKNPETPLPIIVNALYCMLYNNSRYRGEEYCPAVWPFVKHPDWNVYVEGVWASGAKYGGRQRLRKYLADLKKDPDSDPKKIELIVDELHGWEEEDAETAKRIAARKSREFGSK